jgi:hypothetical protein
MKKIHTKQGKRIQIGAPFEKRIANMLKATNTGNLSNNWNETDMVRYCIAQQVLRNGGALTAEEKSILKPFYKDLEV